MSDDRSRCIPDEKLSAFADGDLEAEDVGASEAHLAICDSCRGRLVDFERLKSDLATFVEVPPVEIWSRILEQREREVRSSLSARLRRFFTWPVWSVVGGAAAAMIIGIFVLSTARDHRHASVDEAFASVVAAEEVYVAAIDSLEQAVAGEMHKLRPEVLQSIELGLAQIDDTIRRTRVALREAPGDLRAHRLLLAAYERKVDLLSGLVEDSI